MWAWAIRAVSWLMGSIIGDNVLRFVAGKTLLTALFVVVLPLVVNNLIYDLIEMSFTFLQTNANTSGVSGAMSFTGLTGYVLAQLRVSECLSVLVSALTLRIALDHIPFLRV